MQDDYFNLLNRRNKDVILKKANFMKIEGCGVEQGKVLNQHLDCQVVFSITEPDLVTFAPVVSALKLGTLKTV